MSATNDILLFSFSAAMPPRAEALFPTARWLDAVAGAGYTHLCLQNDPFFHPEMDLRDTGENPFRLLSLFDMTTGPRHRAYLEWLAAVDARAAEHGLKLAMELWEPRLTRMARQVLPADWIGPALGNGWMQPLCVSNGEALRWLLGNFQSLVHALPHLDTLLLGINDNNAVLCGADCPRCGARSEMDRLGALYADIERACHAIRPELGIVPYDWMWEEPHYDAVFSRMSGRAAILTRMERNAGHTPDPEHPEWSGRIFDESVACDGLGSDFRTSQRMMNQYGGDVLVMPTLSGMFENFHLPYVPAAGQIAAKFDRMRSEGVRGWVDYDCGGIHEGLMLDLVSVIQHGPDLSIGQWLDELACRRYGAAGSAALRIWQGFDRAVRLLPGQLDIEGIPNFSGRFSMSMGLMPMHPFLPERVGDGAEAGITHIHWDPHLFTKPQALDPVRTLVAKAREAVAGVPALFRELADQAGAARSGVVAMDRDIAGMVLLNWRSVANFFEWAAGLQGDPSVDLVAVMEDEIATTRRFRELAIRPELSYGNMTWHPERYVAMSAPQASADLWRQIEVNRVAAWTNQPCPDQCGNLWAWKIAHLEMQIARAGAEK